jgi:hypothetical protein
MMVKKLLPCLLVIIVFVLAIQGCGSKPYACITVEGDEDSIHVNQPVTISGLCSSNASEYNWEINLDSVYFTPRITLTFATTGEQEIYLLVTNRGKSAGVTKKLIVHP